MLYIVYTYTNSWIWSHYSNIIVCTYYSCSPLHMYVNSHIHANKLLAMRYVWRIPTRDIHTFTVHIRLFISVIDMFCTHSRPDTNAPREWGYRLTTARANEPAHNFTGSVRYVSLSSYMCRHFNVCVLIQSSFRVQVWANGNSGGRWHSWNVSISTQMC